MSSTVLVTWIADGFAVFVNVHVTVSAAATLIVALPVPRFMVLSPLGSTQAMPVRSQPATLDSVTVYSPGTTFISVYVFVSCGSLPSSFSVKSPPFIVEVKGKAVSCSGRASLMMTTVPFWVLL